MVHVNDVLRTLRHAGRSAIALVLLSSVVATAASWLFGLDAAANAVARSADRVVSISWSALPMLIGLAAPLVVPVALLWHRGRSDRQARVVLAAVVAALVANLVLKALTGRTSPEATIPVDLLAHRQSFAFGFLQGGIWEGWPSGHAMTNTALAVGLWAAFANRWVRTVAFGWAA